MSRDGGRISRILGGGGKSSNTKQRDSNLELFRIITMLLIVAHHYVVNSGLTDAGGAIYSDPLSGRSLFLLLFGAWGKTGINCFVLITGYFMCKSQITVKKFVKLLAEVMFYRVVIWLVFLLSGYEPFSLSGFIKMVLPVTQVQTNFSGCFLIFYLFIPFLNILIHNMDEKKHLLLLGLCAFTYIFFGTLHRVTMNYVSWYIVLFLISSYIRLYPKKLFESKKFWGGMTIVSLALSAASVVACVWLGERLGRDMAFAFVSDSNTFLAVLTGVCSFMFFKNLKVPQSKFINTVAASTFGVLLIHANSDTMRQWLWQDRLNNVGMYSSAWMPLHAVGSVFAIFFVCVLIDHLRIRFLETPFLKLWDRRWNGISAWFCHCETKICKHFTK